MAVQLNHKREHLLQISDVLIYQYEKDKLIKMTDTLFGLPEDTKSVLRFQDENYTPFRIHLTTMLHKGQHDYELIVEHYGKGKSASIFICFPLKKSNRTSPELIFPFVESPLESLFNDSSDCLYYRTSTKNHVFFCSKIIQVSDDFPTVLDNPKKKYKEIFEPNLFGSNQNILTQQDNKPRMIETLTSPKSVAEGFTDGYMECELIGDADGTPVKISEYALTPLNANTYERGMVNFIHFLHFGLVLFVGGIFLPYIQCFLKPISVFTSTWVSVFFCFHWTMFITSIILLFSGLALKQASLRKRRIIAMFGLYIMILFISNTVGMVIQFPGSALWNPDGNEDKYYLQRMGNPMFRHKPDGVP